MTVISTTLGDITRFEGDAIVNAANRSLMGGGGVDGAIHRAGGPAILAECREITARHGPLKTGDAVATTAGHMPASFVIHTAGPIWSEHSQDEATRLLASCYRRSLDVARGLHCRSIAFPNISTGVYGFPKRRAAVTAIDATSQWLSEAHDPPDRIVFFCFESDNYDLYRQLVEADNPPPTQRP